ncbi:hypothetical protein [Hufsiella ginkgonis]|uniref:Uncharacterized protein n=1 Tax=Hufsiella ginkgonis TaxID=2695274 RepID=A0A7K1XTP1_9SPHI|nr:hypothetical protein [Hufsiella ginkgonis]MXV14342.1 hypothetical protein [Hufsiella ginkgonis]
MIDKLMLLKSAYEKAAQESKFLAHTLESYIQIEGITQAEAIDAIGSTQEIYYKLGLCLLPIPSAQNYLEELNKICSYLNITAINLNKIIKRVDSINKFRDSGTSENGFLAAARDRTKEK